MSPLSILLFALPPDLDAKFLDWLETYVAELAPRNSTEIFLVSRIAQALARMNLSAANEPPGIPDAGWLRNEVAADRLFRQSLSALEKYRREYPVDLPLPKPKPAPAPVSSQTVNATSLPPRPATPPIQPTAHTSSPPPSSHQSSPARPSTNGHHRAYGT